MKRKRPQPTVCIKTYFSLCKIHNMDFSDKVPLIAFDTVPDNRKLLRVSLLYEPSVYFMCPRYMTTRQREHWGGYSMFKLFESALLLIKASSKVRSRTFEWSCAIQSITGEYRFNIQKLDRQLSGKLLSIRPDIKEW